MYIFTTCAAILANLVKNKRKMKIFLKKSAIYLYFATKYVLIGGSQSCSLTFTVLHLKVTSIDLKYYDRHAELPNCREPYNIICTTKKYCGFRTDSITSFSNFQTSIKQPCLIKLATLENMCLIHLLYKNVSYYLSKI